MLMAEHRDDLIRGKQAELDLSNEELARRACVSEPTVVKARKGRHVSSTSLKKIGVPLGLSLAELYEPRREPEPAQV